jgi:hypothetical protein
VIAVGFKSGQLLAVLQAAYRKGVLAKSMPVLGNALRETMRRTGKRMDELLDTAADDTVRKLDWLLDRSGPLLRLAASERLMALVSALLDLAWVRSVMEKSMVFLLCRIVASSEGV